MSMKNFNFPQGSINIIVIEIENAQFYFLLSHY